MRNKMTLLAGALLLLAGCQSRNLLNQPVRNVLQDEGAETAVSNDFVQSKYSLYFEQDDYELSLYEPDEGCYLGAYVLSNRRINFEMDTFDALTGKEHGIYIYNMRLGEPYPLEWILECLSEMKTPYIVMHPPNEYNPYQYHLLEQAAIDFGEFYTPVFVDFYPNPKKYGEAPSDYIQFYRQARQLFSKHASNTAFVYTADYTTAMDAALYYPGDDYTDWIGINLYLPLFKEGVIYNRDFWKEVDYVYFQYQHKKPLLISQLAVSYYSTFNHAYYTNESAEKLEEIYQVIKERYPRIKAVNYMDFNSIELSPQTADRDNYSVTANDIMLDSYRRAVADEYFLSDVNVMESGSKTRQWMRSAFSLYEDEQGYYIAEKALRYELDIPEADLTQAESVEISNNIYYSLDIMDNIWNIRMDEAAGKIYLSNAGR